MLTFCVKHSQETEFQVVLKMHRYKGFRNKKDSPPCLYRFSQDQYQPHFHLLILSIVGTINIAEKLIESIVIRQTLLLNA